MFDNKTKTQRLNLCAKADTKYYKLVLDNLFGFIKRKPLLKRRPNMNVINFYEDMTEQQTTGNLKALARRAGLSGVQIAEQMGLRPETVSRHLNGKQNISIEDAMRYAKILGCTAEEILFQRSLCPIMRQAYNRRHLSALRTKRIKNKLFSRPF